MRRLALVFCGVFAATLAGGFPLSLALGWSGAGGIGLSAARISGSIWNGRLEGARLRGLDLGDASARLDPLALVAGTAKLTVESRIGTVTLVNGRARGIEKADLYLSLHQLGLAVPLDAPLRLNDATILFDGGRCIAARGQVAAELPHALWPGPKLEGRLTCVEGAAVAALTGRSTAGNVRLFFAVDAAGAYRLESQLASVSPVMGAALRLAGFRDSGSAFSHVHEGKLH